MPGPEGPQGEQGPQGDPGPAGADSTVPGPAGSPHAKFVPLQAMNTPASAAATNNAVGVFTAVTDPNFRAVVDLRGYTKLRFQGRIGGAVVAAIKIRIQYHTSGNPNIVSGDAGWTTLADSAGTHGLNVPFYTAELAVPAGAQIEACVIRAGIFAGDGAADPTMTACILNFYV